MLNISPFLKGSNNLTAEEEIETKNIARPRIFIEHVVNRLKSFGFENKEHIISGSICLRLFIEFSTASLGKRNLKRF